MSRQNELDNGTILRKSSGLHSLVSAEDDKEAQRLFKIGYDLLQKNDFDNALPIIDKSLKLNPYNVSSANNYALCLMMKGDFRKALEILRESQKNGLYSNPFGMAMIAQLLYILGKDQIAKNTIYIAANLRFQTDSSCSKICETMAYLKMHRDILKFVDQADSMDEESLFYEGVAAANVGDMERAIDALSELSLKSPYAERAQSFIKKLQAGEHSGTPSGLWPYFPADNYSICLKKKEDFALLENSGWIVDFVETAIMEFPPSKRPPLFDLLINNQHPSAEKLLKSIAQGTKFDDKTRFNAVSILSQKGIVNKEEASAMLSTGKGKDGKDKRVLFIPMNLNPEMKTCDIVLPPDVDKEYTELLNASHEANPPVKKLIDGYRKLLLKQPDFFPFENNLASALMADGQDAEAEKIYRKLIAEHPQYLFSLSGLIMLLVKKHRLDEAFELTKDVNFPEEMHPDMLANYYGACANLFAYRKELKIAKGYLDILKQLAPDSNITRNATDVYNAAKDIISIEKTIKKNAKRWK